MGTTDLPLMKDALACGFSNVVTFSWWFHAQFGTPPTKFLIPSLQITPKMHSYLGTAVLEASAASCMQSRSMLSDVGHLRPRNALLCRQLYSLKRELLFEL